VLAFLALQAALTLGEIAKRTIIAMFVFYIAMIVLLAISPSEIEVHLT
jgi:hypothetical protein